MVLAPHWSSQPKSGIFHEKIKCSEWPKMQNKHQNFVFVFGVPNFGEGGGSTWLGQIPKFFQKFDLKAPLNHQCQCLLLKMLKTYCMIWNGITTNFFRGLISSKILLMISSKKSSSCPSPSRPSTMWLLGGRSWMVRTISSPTSLSTIWSLLVNSSCTSILQRTIN